MSRANDGSAALPAWHVEHSRHVLRDRWISVRADDCRTDDGHLIAPYYVLEYPDWVQVVAFDLDDQLVLVEQYRHGLGIVSLELPTGSVEPDDEDMIAAGRRELEEETGLVAPEWRLVGSLAANPANQTNRCHILLALGARPGGSPVNDPSEVVRIRRTPLGEAGRLARSGGIVQAMHVAALALVLTQLGHW